MSKPIIREHNVETGEIVDREMTNEEHKAHLADAKAIDDAVAHKAENALAKAALLERLGITADEAALLLG
jgi:UDP-N-acetylmuramoylalanine-D-glutamate ligase